MPELLPGLKEEKNSNEKVGAAGRSGSAGGTPRRRSAGSSLLRLGLCALATTLSPALRSWR